MIGSYLVRGLALQRELRVPSSWGRAFAAWFLAAGAYLALFRFSTVDGLSWVVAVFARCAGVIWVAWLAALLHERQRLRGALVLSVSWGIYAFVLAVHAAFVAAFLTGFSFRLQVWMPTADSTLLFFIGLATALSGTLGYLAAAVQGASLRLPASRGKRSDARAGSDRAMALPVPDAPEPDHAWRPVERETVLAVLAHEMRQPLIRVADLLESASAQLRDVHGALKVDETLNSALESVHRIGAVLENTLAEAELLGGDVPILRHDVDVDTVVALAVADLDSALACRVQIQRDTTTRTASMNDQLIRLALRNLLTNAFEHAPPASVVTVRIADSDDPLALVFDVQDRGPGIPDALKSRIFTRGLRVDRSAPGRGLGLYIVRRVAEKHGGRADVVSSSASGTTMRIVLPQETAP